MHFFAFVSEGDSHFLKKTMSLQIRKYFKYSKKKYKLFMKMITIQY